VQPVEHIVRSRTPTPGPEMEFVEAALQSAQESGVWHDEDPPIFFREPALPTGFPDLVGVFLNRQDLLFTPERLRLRGEHLQILHHVFSARGTTLRATAEALLRSERSLEILLEELELAELVRRSSHRVRCVALAEVFVAKRIVAVEAKIDKWADAIRQAVANTWFASHSFVLLPDRLWSDGLRDFAARFGVGVLTYDGSQSRVRLRAEKQRLPVSYGSWLINEWTIRQAGKPVS